MLRSASLDHVATTSGIPVFQSGESSKAVQRRYAIPGVVKRIIPLDATTFWEYWWCVPGRLLLPEDAQLLQRDRSRVEAIVSKLIWLWGGHCFGEETSRDRDTEPVYNWQQVLAFAHQQGLKPDLLDIDFLPMAIKLDNRHSDSTLSPAAPNHPGGRPWFLMRSNFSVHEQVISQKVYTKILYSCYYSCF